MENWASRLTTECSFIMFHGFRAILAFLHSLNIFGFNAFVAVHMLLWLDYRLIVDFLTLIFVCIAFLLIVIYTTIEMILRRLRII